ncbi:MAG: hypothetical protein CVU34_12055 [Betaproteobacteria bacterium HGW-Betaproteobacteria-7]|jgi:hypothetical protein|nr:MAG: hypothetical protein CVU34_12055 [Betaproteobacteria bacterium HGW-Betaproteobacteria-7]
MARQLDEIAQLVEQLRHSINSPKAAVPGNTDLSAAIEQLGALTDRATPYAELAETIRGERVVLSPSFAERMERLLAMARQAVASDQNKQQALAYQPNHIPADVRRNNFIGALALLAYGAVSIHLDDFYLPAKRGNGLHIHGFPVLVMFAAVVCAVIVLMLTIIDHYDRRDNERNYQVATRYFRRAGWILFAAALLIHFAERLGFHLV